MITHVKQPVGSSLCGQACVAMYLGMTLEETISWFGGRRSGTRLKLLCWVLWHQGIEVALDSKLKVIYRGVKLPETGILKITWKPPGKKVRQGHWILKVGDYIHDPELEDPMSCDQYMNHFLPRLHGKVTSFMKLPSQVKELDSLT